MIAGRGPQRRRLQTPPPSAASWCLAALLSLCGLVQLPLQCWSLVARPHLGAAGSNRCRHHNHPRRTISVLGVKRKGGESPLLGDDDDEGEPRASPSSSFEGSGPTSSSTNDDPRAPAPVTAEMFWRDMLQDPPVVKRQTGSGKKPKKEYRVLDNRDSLPFSVQLSTPPEDPYALPDPTKRKGTTARPKRRTIGGTTEGKISSQLFMEGRSESGSTNRKGVKSDGGSTDAATVSTLLGEYQLDKHTTTGDVLLIGESQYKVVSHRCLYKYAGGQRFVMVKKILHVKEVGRWQAEEYIKRQWKNSPPSVGSASDPPLELF